MYVSATYDFGCTTVETEGYDEDENTFLIDYDAFDEEGLKLEDVQRIHILIECDDCGATSEYEVDEDGHLLNLTILKRNAKVDGWLMKGNFHLCENCKPS